MFLETANTLAPSSSTLPTSLGVAIVSGYVLDFLKRFKQLPKVNYYSNKLNFWLRLGISGLGTVGVSTAWASTTSGGHSWTVMLPAWSILAAGIWHWVVQYGTQHGWEILLSKRTVAQQAAAEQAKAV